MIKILGDNFGLYSLWLTVWMSHQLVGFYICLSILVSLAGYYNAFASSSCGFKGYYNVQWAFLPNRAQSKDTSDWELYSEESQVPFFKIDLESCEWKWDTAM